MKNPELGKKREIIERYIDYLRGHYNVKVIGIFGSLVRGEHKKHSDIDIMVEFSEPVGFFKFIELEEFLSKILKRKVDLVTKKALKPVIKQYVLKEMVYV